MAATIKPRVNVVIEPKQHELLMELGALQGRSASSYLRELLDVAEPVYRALLPPLRAAERAKSQQPEEARRTILEALQPSTDGEQLSLTDWITGHVRAEFSDQLQPESSAGGTERSGPQRQRGPHRTAPPPSNTGVSFAEQPAPASSKSVRKRRRD